MEHWEKEVSEAEDHSLKTDYALPIPLIGKNIHVALRIDTNRYFEDTYILINNQQPLENLHNSRS